jgi:hypothetical protein
MSLRILWIILIALAVPLAASARGQQADDVPMPGPLPDTFVLPGSAPAADDAAPATSTKSEADDDVILATIFSDQADPFASTAAQPAPQWGDQQVNNGGTHFSLGFAYADKYIYRGVNHDAVATHGNSLNLLIDGRLEFDLGKYPHPFVELFTNIYDADPVSRFQEVRPIVGADWDVKPFDFQVSNVDYIFPDRESFNYPEIDLKATLDDYLLLNTDKPFLSPYILGAFEYQKYEGWYLEFGVKHDFEFEDIGLTVTPELNAAWISGLKQQFVFINTFRDTGWQHLELGLTITYSLNHLLDVSKKYGEFDVEGYGFYDDRLSQYITSSNAFWGGIGLNFKY